jgi:hypothetical protein
MSETCSRDEDCTSLFCNEKKGVCEKTASPCSAFTARKGFIDTFTVTPRDCYEQADGTCSCRAPASLTVDRGDVRNAAFWYDENRTVAFTEASLWGPKRYFECSSKWIYGLPPEGSEDVRTLDCPKLVSS